MKFLQKFARDRSGSIAPLFALIFVPVLGLALTAYDYNRATGVKASLQYAVDNAANAAAQRLNEPASDLSGVVRGFINSNLSKRYQDFPFTLTVAPGNSAVTVTMHDHVPTTLLIFAGIPSLEINVESTVQAPKVPELPKTTDHIPLADLAGGQKGSGHQPDGLADESRAAEREIRAVIENLERSGGLSPELRRLLDGLH